MKLFCRKMFAFTLPEILITLGIIGIIAGMTIPGLITKYQQTMTIIQLKKTFAVLQQAIRMASEDYGDCEGWEYTLPAEEFVNRYFSPYLKSSKVTLSRDVHSYKDLKGNTHYMNNVFMFTDGTLFSFFRYAPMQNKNFILIDLNGTSKPNRLGRDVFALAFYQNILTGYTQYTTMNSWSKDPRNSGTSGQCNRNAAGGVFGPGSYCSTVIIFNNWTIPVGYPWK